MTNQSLSTHTLRDHVKATQYSPRDRKISYAAINAFESLSKKSSFSEKELEPIVKAAFHQHRGPMYVGTELLVALSEEIEFVHHVWRLKARSTKAYERRIAVALMQDKRIPRSIALEIVEKALDDRSAAVREFAVNAGRSRGLIELYSRLQLHQKASLKAE